MTTPLRPTDPRRLGEYQLLGRIGEGGMGTVYLGRAPDGRTVAVKVIRAEFSPDDEFRRRFRSEVSRARQVPPFCTAEVLDADPDHEHPYLVVEYVDGPSLAEVVEQQGPLGAGSLHSVAIGVATALTAIHGAGVIHRDLKPRNVLFALGSPKVIDFGIARALEVTSHHTRTDQMVGTVAYMAPERFGPDWRAVGPAADVFAWGVVVAYAGTGRTPFGGDSPPATAGRILTQPPDLTGLGDPLRDLVSLTLAKDPADRPTARELLDLLLDGGTHGAASVASGLAERPALQRAVEAAQATSRQRTGDQGLTPGPAPGSPARPQTHAQRRVPAPARPGPPPYAGPGPGWPAHGPGSSGHGPGSSGHGPGGSGHGPGGSGGPGFWVGGPGHPGIGPGHPGIGPGHPGIGPSHPGIGPGHPGIGPGGPGHGSTAVRPRRRWGRWLGITALVVGSLAVLGVLTSWLVMAGVVAFLGLSAEDPSLDDAAVDPAATSAPATTKPGLVIADPLTRPGKWTVRDDAGQRTTCDFDDGLVVTRQVRGTYRCPGPTTAIRGDQRIAVDVVVDTPSTCAAVWFRFSGDAGYLVRLCRDEVSVSTHRNAGITVLSSASLDVPLRPGVPQRVVVQVRGGTAQISVGGSAVSTTRLAERDLTGGRIVLGIHTDVDARTAADASRVTFTDVEIHSLPS